VRVQAVINELGGSEKWTLFNLPRQAKLIAAALAPAKEIEVILDSEKTIRSRCGAR